MPLRASFQSYERDTFFPLNPNIQAGNVGAWQDQSHGAGAFIVARCKIPDIGGEIFMVEEAYHTELGVLVVPLLIENFVEPILPGLAYEKDIVDFEGEAGRIIIQHIMPYGHINSLN